MIPHWLWAAWAITGGVFLILWGAVWFGTMEGIAIANKEGGDTLSEVVWNHAHIPAALLFIGTGLIVFGSLWLMLHFASGGKWGI